MTMRRLSLLLWTLAGLSSSAALGQETLSFLESIPLHLDIGSQNRVLSEFGDSISKEELCNLWGAPFLKGMGPWGLGFASEIRCQPGNLPGDWTLRIEDTAESKVRFVLVRKIAGQNASQAAPESPEIQETTLDAPLADWTYAGANEQYIKLVAAAIMEDSPIIGGCDPGAADSCETRIENDKSFDFAPSFPGTFAIFSIQFDKSTGGLMPSSPAPLRVPWMIATSERAKNREHFQAAMRRWADKFRNEINNRSVWKPQVPHEPQRTTWFKSTFPRIWMDYSRADIAFDSLAFKKASGTNVGTDIVVFPNLRFGPEARFQSFLFDVEAAANYLDQEVTGSASVLRHENAIGGRADFLFRPRKNISLGFKWATGGSYGILKISTSSNLPRFVLPSNYQKWGLFSNLGASAFVHFGGFFSIGSWAEATYFKEPNTWLINADLRGNASFTTLSQLGESGLIVDAFVFLGASSLYENLKGKSADQVFSLKLAAISLRTGLGMGLRFP